MENETILAKTILAEPAGTTGIIQEFLAPVRPILEDWQNAQLDEILKRAGNPGPEVEKHAGQTLAGRTLHTWCPLILEAIGLMDEAGRLWEENGSATEVAGQLLNRLNAGGLSGLEDFAIDAVHTYVLGASGPPDITTGENAGCALWVISNIQSRHGPIPLAGTDPWDEVREATLACLETP